MRDIVRFQFPTLTFVHLSTAQHLSWKGLYFGRVSSNLMRKTNALGWSNNCASVLRPADMQVDRLSICLQLSLQQPANARRSICSKQTVQLSAKCVCAVWAWENICKNAGCDYENHCQRHNSVFWLIQHIWVKAEASTSTEGWEIQRTTLTNQSINLNKFSFDKSK